MHRIAAVLVLMMPLFMLAAYPIRSGLVSVSVSTTRISILLAFLPFLSSRTRISRLLLAVLDCRASYSYRIVSSCLHMHHACNLFMFASFRRKPHRTFVSHFVCLWARGLSSFRNLTHLVFQWADTHAAGSTQRVSTTGSRARYYRYLILPWPEGVTPEEAPTPGSGGRNLPTT